MKTTLEIPGGIFRRAKSVLRNGGSRSGCSSRRHWRTSSGLIVAAEEPALEPILLKAAQVAIPVIVLGEYRYGISQSRGRDRYEQWLSEYLPKFRILDVDERTTISYAAVRMELKKA